MSLPAVFVNVLHKSFEYTPCILRDNVSLILRDKVSLPAVFVNIWIILDVFCDNVSLPAVFANVLDASFDYSL